MSRRHMIQFATLALAASNAILASAASPNGSVSSHVVRYQDLSSASEIQVEFFVRGKGPLVVFIPSLGRGARDFDDLATRVAAAGYMTAAVNPRGIGKSEGPKAQSLKDYGCDIREVINDLQQTESGGQKTPVVLVGHAYGNRLARAFAAEYPEAVSSLILLASGGQVAMAPDVGQALADVFNPALSADVHIAAVRTAFFAPGNNPEIWRDGWFGDVALQQQIATKNSPADKWKAAGNKPIYIIQAAQDVVAVPANAEALRAAFPDRVEVSILPNAGHAMLPEQPERIAELVVERLRRQN